MHAAFRIASGGLRCLPQAHLLSRWWNTAVNNVLLHRGTRMPHVTYSDMATRHGHDKAYRLLRTMERLACIRDGLVYFDRDLRFRRAFEALCETNFAW